MKARLLVPLVFSALFSAWLTGCRPSSNSSSGPPPEVVAAVNRGVSQMGQYQYDAAAQSFEQAGQAAPANPDVQVNLAIALFNRGKRELGDLDRPVKLLEEVLKQDPGNARALYFLGIIHTHVGKAELAVPCFEKVVQLHPDDGAAWYLLGLARQRVGQPAEKEFLRAVELRPYLYSAWYKLGQTALAAGDEAKGNAYLDKFKQLRESPLGESIEIPQYNQMGDLALARPLGGRETERRAARYSVGSLVTISSHPRQKGTYLAAPRLPERGAALAEFTGDGQPAIVFSRSFPPYEPILLVQHERGNFSESKASTGLDTLTWTSSFSVGDFDNDGKADLFLAGIGRNQLLKGNGDGTFADVTGASGITNTSPNCSSGLFFDADHDGDLDLLLCRLGLEQREIPPGLELWINSDGSTFTNATAQSGLADFRGIPAGTLVGDLDGDRDMDLVVLQKAGPLAVFLNDLFGHYHKVEDIGVTIRGDLGGALRDFDGDGLPDVLVLSAESAVPKLFLGDGRGHFKAGGSFGAPNSGLTLEGPVVGLRVADLDHDGNPDVVVFGAAVQFWINDGHARFTCQPQVVRPANGTELVAVEVADLNGDLVPDLLLLARDNEADRVAWAEGTKSSSTAVAIQPTGIRSRDGRTRSSASGYGVALTARAGLREAKLYYTGLNGGPNQSSVPAVLGLGGAREADYVHLLWPDGVAQVETNLAAGQVHKISELQRKISSCPVLFTWNGERFEFVTDFAGIGGLGYYVAPGVSAPPQVLEHVKIEPAQLRAKGGAYELRVTEPMEETAYVDRLELLAIDHATNQIVFPDERLAITGPAPTHELLVVENPIFPVKALDPSGRDCTANLAAVDRLYAYTPPLDRRYIGFCAPHTITLDFADSFAGFAPSNRVFLFLHGFIEYPYSQTIFAASQSRIGWEPIRIERQQADGSWRTIVPDAGAFGGMARMMTVDLTGQLGGPRCRLRLTTNMELFYDQLFVARLAGTNDVTVRSVPLGEAVLRRSGFAREVSPDGREPLIYDYQQSDATAPFHVLRGAYTRFGDVKELLSEFDDRYVLVGPGEEIALKFDAAKLPPPVGKTRSFILVSHAYCKDMDLYTATPQTLEPLPFRAMSKYPYPATERFPDAPEHRDWQKTYNTRVVR